MPRWLFPLLLTISPIAFAQYGGGGVILPGGIRLPVGGGGYPGGQYPSNGQCPGGGYPTNGQCPGGQYPGGGQPGMGQMLNGNVRQIDSQQLAMETDDGRIVRMQIQRNTRFYSTFNRFSDFDPGDYISAQVTQDMNGYYYAGTISLTTKGSPQDRQAAMQPLSTSMHTGSDQNNSQTTTQNTSQNDGNGNRPVLHRAGSGSSNSDDSSSSASSSGDDGRPRLRRAGSDDTSSGSASSSSSPSSSDDGDRPRLRRADSTDSSSSPSGSSASSASQSSSGSGSYNPPPASSSRPRAISPGDDGSPAQIAPVQTASVSPMSGDPGPPALRRGAPPRDQNVPETVTPSDSIPQRPSVRSQDVNGVTQVPPPPAPIASSDSPRTASAERLPTPSGISATDDPIVDQAREEAFAFTESLPNYIVKQYTTRYQSDSASRGRTSWQALDIVTADVVAEDGKETYKNLLLNGKPTKDVDKTGSWSEGEFASTLQAILSPASDALFTNRRSTTIVNRPAYRYEYSIEQPRSSWQVYADGARYRPAYGGAVWIDKETSRVLRIEMSARNLPRDFPLDQVESSVDYDFVLIGDKKYLLPTHSEALSCMRGTSECTRNVIEFRNYKKYGADASITFEDPVK